VKKTDLDKISRAEARVLLAQDVIAQLEAKTLVPAHIYCRVITKKPAMDVFTPEDVEYGLDVRDVLKKRAKRCEVCAKGAILIATIMKFDNMPVQDWHLRLNPLSSMASDNDYDSYFSRPQMELIESAYEGTFYNADDARECDAIAMLEDHFPLKAMDRERMVVIMENIIANAGTFKPKQFLKTLPALQEAK
jgi:hypothetical protein